MADERRRRTFYEDFNPQAPETAEFRRIFTRVSRRGQDRKIRSILFTSSERGEGKTTSAALFAVVSSLHRGLRVCLVDADMHRPRIARLFDVASEPGLAEILDDDYPIEATLKATRYEGLRVIPAGGRRESPSELLSQGRIAEMFEKLKLLFDLVVVDAPPLLPVSDPAVISREVDAVAMVVRAGHTRRDVALRAKRILDDVGANLLGVIVNNMDDVLPYYYGHSYYRDAYPADGAKGPEAPEDGAATPKRREGREGSPGGKRPAKASPTGPPPLPPKPATSSASPAPSSGKPTPSAVPPAPSSGKSSPPSGTSAPSSGTSG
ncbi:MAG: CpsD/CapB family tyrosine-protein kinase [bacterium]